MSRPRSYGCAVLMAGTVLFGACTATDDQTSPPDGVDEVMDETTNVGSMASTETTGTASVVAFAEPDAEDFNKLLASDDDLDSLQIASILNVEETDTNQLLISFEMESHYCFGPRTRIEETDSEITIELRTGRRLGVAPGACTYGIYPYTTLVELDKPIGSRTMTQAEAREPEPASSASPKASTPDIVEETDTGADPALQLIGGFVEDGVEWAISSDTAWRILSYEGVPVEDNSADDPDRISFVVVGDRVVSYEWS